MLMCLLANSSDTGTTTRSGLGMTPLSRRKIESGFQSNESNQLMDYLNSVLKCQLKMMCIRVSRSSYPVYTHMYVYLSIDEQVL